MSLFDLFGNRDKGKLRAVFKAAGILRKVGDHTILPKIHSVKYFDERTELVFTLPNGVDPKLVAKHAYVFRQYFGTQTEITGDLKRFVVNVYSRRPSKVVRYDFVRFSEVAEGLPIVCGENTMTGEVVTFDMTTNPHLLNGGQTGGGKSTWLRAVLTFLIEYFTPSDLELYLGDLKAVEFMLFRDVEHVRRTETEPDGIVEMLTYIDAELDRRQSLMAKYSATHIDKLPEKDRVPYAVVVIDEFQDLRGHEEAMRLLMRVGAKGRALGIFLILTTQRPSAAIVDGDIKANLTVSMAFKTKNRLNSNMILDAGAPDASQLRGQGHGIVALDKYIEVQAPYLSEDDARKILARYTRKEPAPMPVEQPTSEAEIFTEEEAPFD